MELQRSFIASAAGALGLEAKKRRLALEAARIAGEGTRAADDAMARHDDRDRVAADGGADGPARRGHAERAGDVAVAARRARGDLQEGLPHFALERRPLQIEA